MDGAALLSLHPSDLQLYFKGLIDINSFKSVSFSIRTYCFRQYTFLKSKEGCDLLRVIAAKNGAKTNAQLIDAYGRELSQNHTISHQEDELDKMREASQSAFWLSLKPVHGTLVHSQLSAVAASSRSGQKRARDLQVEPEKAPQQEFDAVSNSVDDNKDSETATAVTPSRSKPASSPQKRKAGGFMLDLKEPTFPTPESPTTSLHVAFEKFRSCARTKAGSAPLDFSKCKGEALALNGIWYVGNVVLDSPDVTQIHRAMRREYRPPEYQEIGDLTAYIEDILDFGTEEEIAREIDGMSDADLSWRARKALKVWRQLLDALPSEPRPDQPNGEQTFVSQSLQPFLAATFSARGKMSLRGNVEHDSAYEDKREHRHGTRSDFFVTVPVASLATTLVCLIGEVKPPEVKSIALEQMDQWKIFRMMKAELDSQVRKGIEKAVVWGCQIFDNEITFFVMDRRLPPMYTLFKALTGTLPRSTQDISGVARIISAFFFVESFMTERVKELEARPSEASVPTSPLLKTLQPNEITPKKKRQ